MKYELEAPDLEEDLILYGISCHEKAYRLCWAVNLQLSIALERDPEGLDLTIPASEGEKEELNFPLFTFFDEEGHIAYTLVENHREGHSLIPERKEIDHFLMIQGEEQAVDFDPSEELRKTGPVLAVFRIEPSSMKKVADLLI